MDPTQDIFMFLALRLALRVQSARGEAAPSEKPSCDKGHRYNPEEHSREFSTDGENNTCREQQPIIEFGRIRKTKGHHLQVLGSIP